MSQHIQHHPQQSQYVHYAGPSTAPPHPYMQNVAMIQGQPQHMHHILHYQPQGVAHQQHQHQQQHQLQPQAPPPPPQGGAGPSGSGNSGNGPLVAQGDWTKDLVQLAKQAELKKHALALQLHTAHVLSAHASLEQKSKAIQDIKEQKNKLESERARLIKCLQEINSDRDQADLAEATLDKECTDLRNKITQLSEGEYAIAKTDVDRLRSELGQPPLPSLQQTLQERTAQYLTERRLNGNEPGGAHGQQQNQHQEGSSTPGAGTKRGAPLDGASHPEANAKRPRGRPKGSKNKKMQST